MLIERGCALLHPLFSLDENWEGAVALIEIENVSVAYAGPDGTAGAPFVAVDGVNLTVAPGEVLSLLGANGSGKSSLVALVCGAALPAAGRVLVDGVDGALDAASRLLVRRNVGYIQQNPQDQLVSTTVEDEVAFGPNNLGLAVEEVDRRVDRALETVGLVAKRRASTAALSGGEQQRLALAGVLAMEPRYLVLDEATSMVDAAMRPEFRALFCRLAREQGVGVIQVTHDPEEVLASDRAVVMEGGRVVWDGAPLALLTDEAELWDRTLVDQPSTGALRAMLTAVCAADANEYANLVPRGLEGVLDAFWNLVRSGSTDARTVARVRGLLDAGSAHAPHPDDSDGGGSSELALDGVTYRYDRALALDDVSLAAPAGRVLLVAGPSGSGKSTLAYCAAGLFEPDEGSVTVAGAPTSPGRCAMAFQRPENQLFLDTVYDELAFAPRNMGAGEDEVARLVEAAAELVGVDASWYGRYPFDLSGGQARRVAMASTLAIDADAYVFDEPTAGLDAAGRAAVHALVREVAARGRAVVVISHDLEEWIGHVDALALVRAGRLVWSGAADGLAPATDVFERAGLLAPWTFRLAERLEAACAAAEAGDRGEERGRA